MDTSSLVALGISILVILLVQTLVIISIAAHLFIRYSSTNTGNTHSNHQPEPDVGHSATLSNHLHNRNISAPLTAAQIAALPRAHADESLKTLYRDPTPSLPSVRQNPTADERFARAFGPSRERSSTYSQPSRANDEDSMATSKNSRKEQTRDLPASHKYYFHDSD